MSPKQLLFYGRCSTNRLRFMRLRNELSLIKIYLQTIAYPPAFPHIARMHRATIQKSTRIALLLLASSALAAPLLSAETPAPEATKAFDSYVQAAEARNNEELAAMRNFLWVDVLPERERERTYRLLNRQQT